jgi:DNA-directed RNA polymerase specialized sigma24 family protein
MRALLKRIRMPPDAATTPDAAKALGLHLAGYTYVEIAAELGCTPDEAYDLVREALKEMKR